jgi:diguanylate cyclase (GGDEF)-like protein
MYYSLVGLLALLTLIITNHDVFLRNSDSFDSAVVKVYRSFLFAVIAYYITDMAWGVLEALSLTALLYLDTEIYFMAMALGVLFWTQYVIAYLEEKSWLKTFLRYAGIAFFIMVIAVAIVNFFYPIMFWFDETGVYHTGIARNVTLVVQILILLLTSIYALQVSSRRAGSAKNRYRTVGLSGLVMLIFISIQVFQPYLPLYAIGYMMGNCLLRTFVIEGEREEYRSNLETALARERQQLQELNTVWKLAYTDALTGVKSKFAYIEKEDEIDEAIAKGTADAMAIVVFDVNDLKSVNDAMGHEIGDDYIISACNLICDIFKHSPVFRIGGDEFVTVLEGDDYRNRDELLNLFNQRVEENRAANSVIVSAGIADYIPGQDNDCRRIFERADNRMYIRKSELKEQEPQKTA